MTALYDQLTEEQQLYLREYIRLTIKQDVSTTGLLAVNADDELVLTDVHAAFITNSVTEGDSIEFYVTTPPSVTPVGTYLILDVVSETEIKIDGDVKSLGVHAKYRVINTSDIQQKLNDLYLSLASLQNVDKVEALRLEAINVPWYTRTTSVVLQYFAERTALDGYIFFYPVTQTDLDHVTLVPQPTLPPPFTVYGPLLYPYGYTGQSPDRRSGSPFVGLGTPSLLGLPDTSPPTIPPDPPGIPPLAPIPLNAGEGPALTAEDTFYSNHPYGIGYSALEIVRLNSIEDAQDDALTREINAINALIAMLDDELTDLRERGVLNTGFYATLTVARSRLNIALAQASYAQSNVTDGLPAITTSGSPTAARLNFIQNVRPQQIVGRLAQVLVDQAPWVQQRYTFLSRRVNPSDGSLADLRRINSQIAAITPSIAALIEERETINDPIGVNA